MLFLTSLMMAAGFAQCPANQFPAPEVVQITCGPDSATVGITLEPYAEKEIVHFPAGTKDIVIELSSAEGDLDICLYDAEYDTCVHQAASQRCLVGWGCNILNQDNTGGTAVAYEGVTFTFTGDDTTLPVSETLTITGTLRNDMYLEVLSHRNIAGTGTFAGQVNYRHQGIDRPNCQEEVTSCLPCSHHECPAGQHQVCNGATATCTTCATNQVWDATAQICRPTPPTCAAVELFGPPGIWSHAQRGMQTRAGGVSDGCCSEQPNASVRGQGAYCQSTGDPHILQFDDHTNHAYINGDYLMYKGHELTVGLRHVNIGRVAGNNAFFLTGALLFNHKLEFYDLDTASNQPDRTEPKVLINGNELTGTRQEKYDKACDFFVSRQIVCGCGWTDGMLNMFINDETTFRFDRWHNTAGWNNAYLQINPADKLPGDVGMCTSTAPTNSQLEAGNPNKDPYPESRLQCYNGHDNDMFTLRDGNKSDNTFVTDYFCGDPNNVRRRFESNLERRRFGAVVTACAGTHREMLTAAYEMCKACSSISDFRVEQCLLDACMMADIASMHDTEEKMAEFAAGEAAGCVAEQIVFTAPENRAALCPAGTDWNPDLQSCAGTFAAHRGKECTGGAYARTVNTFIADCHEMCKNDLQCGAYTFDPYSNNCRIWQGGCTVFAAASDAHMTTYVKDTSGHIISRGSTLDASTGQTGPQATYGQSTTTSAGNGQGMGPLDQLDLGNVQHVVDDVHNDVDDLSDTVQDLHDEFEESVKDLTDELHDEVDEIHDAVSELRTALGQITMASGQPVFPQFTTPYGGTTTQPSNNDDSSDTWKVVGIVSMVMTVLVLCCAIVGCVGFFCYMRK